MNGQIVPALLDLVERDLVRVLDLLVLKKDDDGSVEAFELSDLDEGEIGELRTYESELAMLLSEEDVNSLAAAIEPGSRPACWCGRTRGPRRSPPLCAVRAVSLWLVAGSPRGRCSRQLRPMSKKKQPTRTPSWRPRKERCGMPLARARMGRGGVIGPRPVARTAAIGGTAAVVSHGVRRRSDRREDRGDDRGDRRDDRRDRR
jgi:hypothetical protein